MWKIFYLASCYIQLQNWKYLASIINGSVITNDKTIEETKTVSASFYEKSSL